MKKAKRLLAVMLAAVMLMTAAYLPSYAYTDANIYIPPQTSNIKGYYYTYDQAAGYLLDMLDQMLGEANLVITCNELNDLVGIGINLFTSNIMLNLDDYLEDAHDDNDGDNTINLTSVDKLITSLYGVADCLANNWVSGLGDAIGLLGDLVDEDAGLGRLWPYSSKSYQRANANDTLVLEYLVQLVVNGMGPMVRDLLGGSFDAGSLLGDMLNDLLSDFLGPRASLSTLGTGIKDLLYSMLINTDAEIMNGDLADGTQMNELDDPDTAEVERVETVDDMVQLLIDWALIDGTGEYAYNGGMSMLGRNAEPLLPDLANQPGGADLGPTAIQSDRDLDGALENNTMSLYQLVANVLEALLGGMLTPMLSDLIVDLVGIEITEEYPNGDPEISGDMMYGLLLGSVTRDSSSGALSSTAGAIENLLVANGAPALEIEKYDSEELPADTPVGHVTAVIKWFLDDGGLDTLIKIDYQGIHIQDNLMSLLNDLIRLAINLLPALGLEVESDLLYTPDQLNEYWAYDADMNIVNGADAAAVDSLYLTYEADEIVYVDSYIENADGSKTPNIYCYYENGSVVNTTDPTSANYRNPNFIRTYYVVSTDQVYACVIKVVLDMMIDGCYFPEWADDIPTVLAYGLASLASPLLPQNNYFARLDAYHTSQTKGSDQFDSNGVNITPIPYSVEKTITVNDPDGSYTKTISVPQAALDIGCSYLASYLNAILDISDQEKLDTDTSLEKFAGEFLVWGFTNYLPMFTGKFENGVLKNYYYSGILVGDQNEVSASLEEGIFQAEVNAYLAATYEDWTTRTPLSDDDNDAAYDAIYTLLDDTIFKLIPTSWLPDIHGSQQLVLDWLLGNICEFDIQGILDLLSVNMDADAELNLPVIQVLLRVIDRVLALLVNDHPLLLSVSRGNIITADDYNTVATSVTTLEGLLDCSSPDAALPQLVYQLLVRLNQFKRPLLSTLLPILFAAEYERPYDDAYLGSEGIAYYKVADLEAYTDKLTKHINATLIKSFDNEADAEAACDGNATSVRNDDGTYSIKLSNETIYATYPDSASAASDLKLLKNAYYTAVESEEIDEETGEYLIASYDVYYREDYMTTAYNMETVTDTTVDYGQTKYEYTDFAYASFYPRSAARNMVEYGYEYQTFEAEDFSGKEYYYTNAENAIEDAQNFADSYRSFATGDLVDAYGDWYMYSVETQLRTNDIWDPNNDGKSVNSDTDGDYVAPTTDTDGNVTDEGVPVDDEPSMPSSMYPFYTTTATAFAFYDEMTASTITSESMNLFNTTNYDQLALAVEYGSEPRNNVTLSESDTESVIRLALYESTSLGTDAMQFDITYNADNAYDGTLQWQTLTDDQLIAIANWLTAEGFTYEAVLDETGAATGAYTIARPAFKLIDSSFSISTPGIAMSSTPAHPTDSTLTTIQSMGVFETKTDYQENYVTLYKAYREYITALYQNRRSLYNTIDMVSYRLETAESMRSVPMENNGDLIILDWVIAHANQYYMFDAGRNYKSTGTVVNGVAEVTKVYTATSFENFQRAYDFAVSLREKVVNNAASNEVTQSMVTAAYQGILYAIRQLVEFTGFADWTQLDYYMAMAKEILEDPNKNDSVLGYASGLDALEDIYNDSLTLRADTTIDCESQTTVDNQAATLNSAIQNLVFNTEPSILPTDLATSITDTITVTNTNNRIVGHVFGLAEGTGITNDMLGEDGVLTIAGMTIDEEIGSNVSISPSGRGNGTGSYVIGRVRSLERFRYFAVVYGDLNGDTRIDGSDAAYIQYHIANGTANETDMGHVLFVAADANHDNDVDASDVKYIQNHYTYGSADLNGDGVVDENDAITQDYHRVESAQ